MADKITPHQLDLYSANMASLYNSLEGEILRILIKRLRGGSSNITVWQAEKLRDLHLFNDEVATELSKLTGVAYAEIERMFQETGIEMVNDIDSYMPYQILPVPTTIDNVMRGYFEQSWSEIDNYVNQTLVSTNYGYRSIATITYQNALNRTTAYFLTGMNTIDEALEKAITEMAQQGIRTTLVDKGGHTWSLERYVRTVLKSTSSNAYNQIRTERMDEYGVHTVQVTSHMGARDACSKIQGNVVDLRPPEALPIDSKYKSIYDGYWNAEYGEAGGHRGINCAHLHIPFIDGVNTNNQPQFDEEENAEVARNRDRQRELERRIVKYKKNLMVAERMESQNTEHWRSMVSKSQKAMRDHLKENGKHLRRNYKREKVYTPLNNLLLDFSYSDF
ncbi:phage minor capsid protein [Aerococcus viridans]|uniref:phage minor capsid protein n=1 Tax=Aerococcus viridans TaxID=1377 RepID=UPI00223B854B|nr:phage minor capsid protein [Aerococcus viridans]